MRPPKFWYEETGSSWPMLLAPLGKLYEFCARTRWAMASPRHLSIPVICVGNLVAGGAGKTPTAIAIAKILQQRGVDVHFILRGYGDGLGIDIRHKWRSSIADDGDKWTSVRVNSERHFARQVGDEALLLAQTAPTWSGKDRAASANSAIKNGAQCLILDDGFQNPSLHKDLSLVVIDGAVGLGSGKVMPAGPLRENPARGLGRAQGVLILGDDLANVEKKFQKLCQRPLPMLRAKLQPAGNEADIAGKRVYAFAGIGRPEKFFATLKEMGCELVETAIFDDHHFYTTNEIPTILIKAGKMNAIPVTTEKDYLRIGKKARADIHYLPVAVAWRVPVHDVW